MDLEEQAKEALKDTEPVLPDPDMSYIDGWARLEIWCWVNKLEPPKSIAEIIHGIKDD